MKIRKVVTVKIELTYNEISALSTFISAGLRDSQEYGATIVNGADVASEFVGKLDRAMGTEL